jgi:hypothetical protein
MKKRHQGSVLMTGAIVAAIALVAIGLGACSETSMESSSPPMAASAPMRTGSAADETACLSAVAQQTGNSVIVTSSEFSQANTVVMVGVGPQRAPWRCLVSNGVVAEVTSMADEGAL